MNHRGVSESTGPPCRVPREQVRPLWVLHGGPQVDPLRRLLNHGPNSPYIAVSTRSCDRMTAEDVPAMQRLAGHADAFIVEHLPAGYRDLPIGVEDLLPYLRPGIPICTFPRITYAGLHPFQVGPDPQAGLADPPLVPYHDLRTVAVASGTRTVEQAWNTPPSAQLLREFAAWQLLRLRREESHTDVSAAGAVRAAGIGAVHTVDRPGDSLLTEIARGIQTCLGMEATASEDGVGLMGQCRGPVDPDVALALGLDTPATDQWTIHGQHLSLTDIHVTQMEWYRQHPDVLKAVLAAHAARMEILGLL